MNSNTPVVLTGSFQRSYESINSPKTYQVIPFSQEQGANARSGSSNPGWLDRILAHTGASSAYSRSGLTVSLPRISVDTRYDPFPGFWQTYGWSGSHPGFNTPSLYGIGNEDTALRDRAVERLRNRLNTLGSSVNSLVPLGEIHETRDLILHAAKLTKSLLHELQAIKRGDLSGFLGRGGRGKGPTLKGTKEALANAWLTYSFGIKPTLSDISNIAGSIASWFYNPGHTDRVTASADKRWHETHEAGGIDSTGPGALIGSIQQFEKHLSYKFVVAHRFNVYARNDYSLLQKLGFTPGNLVPTAWELIPWSWMADYFTTAGQFLEDNFTAIPGDSIYIVENRKFDATAVITPYCRIVNNADNPSFEKYSTRNGGGQYFEFSRIPLSSIPRRSLRFKSADEVGRNSVNRLLNLVSLLARK